MGGVSLVGLSDGVRHEGHEGSPGEIDRELELGARDLAAVLGDAEELDAREDLGRLLSVVDREQAWSRRLVTASTSLRETVPSPPLAALGASSAAVPSTCQGAEHR